MHLHAPFRMRDYLLNYFKNQYRPPATQFCEFAHDGAARSELACHAVLRPAPAPRSARKAIVCGLSGARRGERFSVSFGFPLDRLVRPVCSFAHL